LRELGPFGNGTRIKLIANLLVAVHNCAAAEALVLARRAGLDAGLVYEAIKGGAGSSRMFEVRGPMMVAETYQPATMKIDVFDKDLGLIAAFAKETGSPTPLFDAAATLYAEALAGGHGKDDSAAVHAVLAKKR
jgi:3-hydroxyisobutyrate dehydrogenase-like beta-hydroxyacid dehydrogenase